jgi:hypothetical protein
MWRMVVDDADPATMFDEAEKLRGLAERLGEITTMAHGVAQDVLGAWEGDAAANAAGQMTEFLRWADDTANTANNVAHLLGQYAHVVNRARLSMPYPSEAGGLTPQGHTATAAQEKASKTEAVHVMEHYAGQSRDIYAQLHNHRFTAPPSGTGGSVPPPAPEPHAPVHQPPTDIGVTTPSAVSTSTTPSGFVGSAAGIPGAPSGGSAGTAAGTPSPAGIMSGGLPPDAGAARTIFGPRAASGLGAAQTATGRTSAAGAVAEEPEESRGVTPLPPGSRARGDQDGNHRNRYGQKVDLIGELPATAPPVIGL